MHLLRVAPMRTNQFLIRTAVAGELLLAAFSVAAASCDTDAKEAPDGRRIVMFGYKGKLTQMAPGGKFLTYEFQTKSDSHELYLSGTVVVVLHRSTPVVTMIFTSGDGAGRYTYTCDSQIAVQR